MSEVRSRSTRQRAALLALLTQVPGFLSAQELHARLQAEGASVGLATVYRALQDLTERGVVDVLHTGDGEAVYRRCSTDHHHHLVCRRCGRAVEVVGPAVEAWASEVGTAHGFSAIEHQVDVFGVCAECTHLAAPDLAAPRR